VVLEFDLEGVIELAMVTELPGEMEALCIRESLVPRIPQVNL
jgi:hypothetical protein